MFKLPGNNAQVTVGYVIIPIDIPREKYIMSCYQNSEISIRANDGALFNRVPICTTLLDELTFPEKYSELGTAVLCVNDNIQNKLFAIGTLLDKENIKTLKEGDFMLQKQDKQTKTTVEVVGSAKSKFIGINVNTEEEQGGTLYINVTNNSKTAKVIVNCNGTMKTTTSSDYEVESFSQQRIQTINPNDIEEFSSIQQNYKEQVFESSSTILRNKKTEILSEEVLLGRKEESRQRLALGEELKKQLEIERTRVDTIIRAIELAPIVPGDGGASFKSSIISALQNTLSGDYKNILSKILSSE